MGAWASPTAWSPCFLVGIVGMTKEAKVVSNLLIVSLLKLLLGLGLLYPLELTLLSLWNGLIYPWQYSWLWNLLCLILIVIPAFFWWVWAWHIFFHPFTFNLFGSFYSKCISRTHIVGSCFFIQSGNLCLLIGVFAFKVFRNMVWFTSTVWLFVLYSNNLFILPYFIFSRLLLDLVLNSILTSMLAYKLWLFVVLF